MMVMKRRLILTLDKSVDFHPSAVVSSRQRDDEVGLLPWLPAHQDPGNENQN